MNQTECYIALGSNLANPMQQIGSAIEALRNLPKSSLLAVSPWYQTAAVGPGEQPDYINAVAKLATLLTARQLLKATQAIEQAHQRRRTLRWGPRTLDLDILVYGQLMLDEPDLTIPHPRLGQRHFVLYPLFDIAPDLILPDQRAVRELRERCSPDGIRQVVTQPGALQ